MDSDNNNNDATRPAKRAKVMAGEMLSLLQAQKEILAKLEGQEEELVHTKQALQAALGLLFDHDTSCLLMGMGSGDWKKLPEVLRNNPFVLTQFIASRKRHWGL